MKRLPDLEPLIDDGRLARIEAAYRKRYPTLPEGARFVTFLQPPDSIVLSSGIEVPTGEIAVLAVLVPNTRHGGQQMFDGRIPYRDWRAREYDHRHSTDLADDPAYQAYHFIVPQAVRWAKELEELN